MDITPSAASTSSASPVPVPAAQGESAVGIDRRHLLRLGGFSIAAAVVIAACGSDSIVGTPLSGSAPAIPAAGAGTYGDVTLLRTATSLHYSDIAAIDVARAISGLDPKIAAFATSYATTMKTQADFLAQATTAAGGTPYTKPNPRFTSVVITPALALLAVSSSPTTDAARFIESVVSHNAETAQFFVGILNKAPLRSTMMQVGSVHARAAAVLASMITPENIVTDSQVAVAALPAATTPPSTVAVAQVTVPGSVTPTTKASSSPDIPVYQVPSAFGTQSAVQLVLGNKDKLTDDVKRQTLNFETLFLNSFVSDTAT